jgi:peptidoglycan/LPS O-acetylase OafA/YrhL
MSQPPRHRLFFIDNLRVFLIILVILQHLAITYGAYLLQAPVLVYVAVALQGVEMPLLLKFVFVSPVAVAFCFGTAYLLRKIPKADNIL